jgi:hypothetical protein
MCGVMTNLFDEAAVVNALIALRVDLLRQRLPRDGTRA